MFDILWTYVKKVERANHIWAKWALKYVWAHVPEYYDNHTFHSVLVHLYCEIAVVFKVYKCIWLRRAVVFTVYMFMCIARAVLFTVIMCMFFAGAALITVCAHLAPAVCSTEFCFLVVIFWSWKSFIWFWSIGKIFKYLLQNTTLVLNSRPNTNQIVQNICFTKKNVKMSVLKSALQKRIQNQCSFFPFNI